ncbi:hypothetical protein M1C59_00290 [Gordonia terrae]|uniref:hypothetical protein n=1 Tax=Gordonia terrae TaxID=2055 RepID=UPI00200A0978|nr:hypothetical protein [Gordonia terrae]UPW09363.1 hypothetical protein M1C59_00290 [Gordonia terrae]
MPLRTGRSDRPAVIGHPVVRMPPSPGSGELIVDSIRRRATTALSHNGFDSREPATDGDGQQLDRPAE